MDKVQQEPTEPTHTLADAPVCKDKALGRGDLVGRFEIVRIIGAGGMGRIYEAHDPKLGRRIALKLLRDDTAELHRARLVREAQALARLGHPNVVTVHDVGTHNGSVFIAMELVTGGTLKDWCREHPLDGSAQRTREAMRLLIDAGRGLVAAHKAGLIHRDVKPGNILIGEDGRARVADFGIARATVEAGHPTRTSEEIIDTQTTDLTRTGTAVGTPAYMAPEQFDGKEVGPAADQFAFCVTAWEVLHGVRPFAGRTMGALSEAIHAGKVRRGEVKLDAKLDATVRRGLAHKVTSRHRSLADLVEGLEPFAGATTGPRTTRWAIALGVVATLGAGTAYQLGSTDALCGGGDTLFAKTWNAERRTSVQASILASQPQTAKDEAWPRFARWLDGYAEDWTAVRQEACEAQMDERMNCLDLARMEVETLLAAVEDDGAVGTLDFSSRSLVMEPQECNTARSVDEAAHPGVVAGVIRANVLIRQGRFDEAFTTLEEAAKVLPHDARSRTASRVALLQGRSSFLTGRYAAAEAYLRRAYSLSRRVGALSVQGDAALELAQVLEVLEKPLSEVRMWLEAAENAWSGQPTLRQQWLSRLVRARIVARDLGPAAGLAEHEALVTFSDEQGILQAHARELLVSFINGWKYDPDRGLALAREALAMRIAQSGDSSPRLLNAYKMLCNVMRNNEILGREEATAVCRDALSKLESMDGIPSRAMASVRLDLVGLYLAGGQTELASPLLEEVGRYEDSMRPQNARRLDRARRDFFAKTGETPPAELQERWAERASDANSDDLSVRFAPAVVRVDRLWREGQRLQAKQEADLIAHQYTTDRIVELARRPRDFFAAGSLVGLRAAWGDDEGAVELGERIVHAIVDPMPKARWDMRIHTNLCSAYSGLDRLEDAKRACLRAIDGAGLDPDALIGATINLGVVHFENGELNKADVAYKDALELLEERDDPMKTAVVLANIGEVAELQGRFEEAIAAYGVSLDLRLAQEPANGLGFPGLGLIRSMAAFGRIRDAKTVAKTLEERLPKEDMRTRAGLAEAVAQLVHGKERTRSLEQALRLYDLARASDEVQRLCAAQPAIAGCAIALPK